MENTTKVPVLKDSYLLFKMEVKLWEAITSVEVKKRAGTIVLNLPGKAKSVILDKVPFNELADGVTAGNVTKSGVDRLLEELDHIYLEDVEKEKFNAYDSFRKLKRNKSQTMSDFMIEFDKKIKRLEEFDMKLPSGVLAYELLQCSNISNEKADIAKVTCSPWTYENMKSQLKRVASDVETNNNDRDIIKVVKVEDTFYTENLETNNHVQDYEDVYLASRGRGNNRARSYMNYGNRWNGYRGKSSLRNQSNASYRIGDQRRNPKDMNGNVLQCYVCGSIFHFANKCPEKAQNQKNERINLFQNSDYDYSDNSLSYFTYSNFGLAVLDSGCNSTVCGEIWLKAYLDSLDAESKKLVKYESNRMFFRFGDNKPSLSEKRVTLPAVVCDKPVRIIAQIVKNEIPLLISKKTMKTAKMKIDFSDDTVQAFGQRKKLIITPSGHCSIPLSKQDTHNDICLCSADNIVLLNTSSSESPKAIVEKLHKQFAHPTPDRLKSFLKTNGRLSKEISMEIDNVTKGCEICRRYKPCKVKPAVSLPLAKDFGDCLAMDIKVYDAKNNIYFHHMIDHATRFSVATLLKSKVKEEIVQNVFTHWISIFGRPKKILTDNGGEYFNSCFIDMCDKLGVHVRTTGAEATWSNGIVE